MQGLPDVMCTAVDDAEPVELPRTWLAYLEMIIGADAAGA